jgi:hypothetical protein
MIKKNGVLPTSFLIYWTKTRWMNTIVMILYPKTFLNYWYTLTLSNEELDEYNKQIRGLNQPRFHMPDERPYRNEDCDEESFWNENCRIINRGWNCGQQVTQQDEATSSDSRDGYNQIIGEGSEDAKQVAEEIFKRGFSIQDIALLKKWSNEDIMKLVENNNGEEANN